MAIAAAFEDFVRRNFAGDQAALDTLFARCEKLFEQLDGHMLEIKLATSARRSDLDLGPIQPFDEILAGYDPRPTSPTTSSPTSWPSSCCSTSRSRRSRSGWPRASQWSRRQWAEARLAQRFSKRVPAEVNLAIAQAGAEAEQYIAEYNIWMHHLLDDRAAGSSRPKMRLLSHWNLRDEIKADYGDAGRPRQASARSTGDGAHRHARRSRRPS